MPELSKQEVILQANINDTFKDLISLELEETLTIALRNGEMEFKRIK